MLHDSSPSHDFLAQFSNEDLIRGFQRLFSQARIQLCRKCGAESRHKTCTDCRKNARTLLEVKRRHATRSDSARYARKMARRAA